MLRNKGVVISFLVFLGLTLGMSLVYADQAVYDSGKRRDPFIALTSEDLGSATSSSGYKLEGIIYDPGARSMAIVNGKTYQTEEPVGEATIKEILKDHIVIVVDGEEKTLWIRDEENF